MIRGGVVRVDSEARSNAIDSELRSISESSTNCDGIHLSHRREFIQSAEPGEWLAATN
jgi:hypothetical protein